jgi:hypothetical protein
VMMIMGLVREEKQKRPVEFPRAVGVIVCVSPAQSRMRRQPRPVVGKP